MAEVAAPEGSGSDAAETANVPEPALAVTDPETACVEGKFWTWTWLPPSPLIAAWFAAVAAPFSVPKLTVGVEAKPGSELMLTGHAEPPGVPWFAVTVLAPVSVAAQPPAAAPVPIETLSVVEPPPPWRTAI